MKTERIKKNTKGNKTEFPGVTLRESDAVRLIQEGIEELNEMVRGLNRIGAIRLLRRTLRAGITVVKAERQTVTLEKAAWSSVEARAGLRPVTLRDLRHYVRRILKAKGAADLPLRAITARECRRILQEAFGSSRSSYIKGRAVLSSIFSHGMRQEWCDANPVRRIEVPKAQEQRKEPLNEQEIRQLLSTANKAEFRDMRFSVRLLLYAGIRPAEVEGYGLRMCAGKKDRLSSGRRSARPAGAASFHCAACKGSEKKIAGFPQTGSNDGKLYDKQRDSLTGCPIYAATHLPAIMLPISETYHNYN